MRRLAVAAAALLAISCAAPAEQVAVQAPPPAAAFDPVGVYDFTTQVDGSSVTGVLTIRRNTEGRLTATLSTPVTGDLPISNVTQDGRNLEMRTNIEGDSMLMRVNVNAEGVLTGGWELSSGMRGGVSGRLRGTG